MGAGASPATPEAPAPVAPGTLSRLLADLVRAPEEAPASAGPLPGTVIGRFELVRQLGAGGFGVVWEARDRELDRAVAFKLVRPGAKADLRGESLRREAEAAARLSHDNIVALHDVGTSEHGPYLVLELLRGQTLAERLAQRPLDPHEALRVFREVVRGVAHAHAEGVVHRDLKPGNVFLCADGRVKVLDFGLAHAFGRRRQSGGTPAYMAPEQWREAPEDERTDVFALGVMLYQLLSGGLPFATEQETVGRQRAPTLELDAAPELGELVARMLAKDPVERPRDAGAVLAAVEAARLALDRVAPGATSLPVRTRRHPGWRLAALVAGGAAVGLVVALLVVGARRGHGRADGRLQVAVADVLNETGEKELDVLSGLLVTSLEQSRRLAVMTQARVLDLAAQGGRTGLLRVDEAVGREVGRENGVTTLLLPAIRRLGATYSVELRAIDPTRDEHLFTVSDRASSKEGLLDLLDRLSDKARRELHEDQAEVDRSRVELGKAMTRSLEAYQHYVAGVEARFGEGLRAVALREQEKAIELDPQFAAAHLQLAIIKRFYDWGAANPHWEIADRYEDRMPEKERAIIRLWRAMRPAGHHDPKEAQRVAEELMARFADDKFAVYMAGVGFRVQGLLEREEEAYRRALQLDPGYLMALDGIGPFLRGRSEEYLAIARRAVASRRSAANLAELAEALLQAGVPEEAAAAASEALEALDARSAEVAEGACGTLRALGRMEACTRSLDRISREGLNDGERFRARSYLAGLLALQGRAREAAAILHPGSLLFPFEVGRARQNAPAALADFGDFDTTKQARRGVLAWYGDLSRAAQLDATMGLGDRTDGSEREYRALLASHEGRHAEAARAWAEEIEREQRRDGLGSYRSHYLLAEALLADGRAAEAAQVQVHLAKADEDPLDVAQNYPRLALVRSLALARLGRGAEATKELDALLDFWKEADQDLPLVLLARDLRRRIVAGEPPPAGAANAPLDVRFTSDEVLGMARREASERRSAASLFWLAVALQKSGQPSEAAEVAGEALRVGDRRAARYATLACARPAPVASDDDCIEALQRGLDASPDGIERENVHSRLVTLLSIHGRVREAQRLSSWSQVSFDDASAAQWRRTFEAVGRWRLEVPTGLAAARREKSRAIMRYGLAHGGDLAGAAQVDASLPPAERAEEPWAGRYRAVVAMKEGRHDEASQILRAEIKKLGESSYIPLSLAALLAESLLGAGQVAEVADLDPGWPTTRSYDEWELAVSWPRLTLLRARAMEQLGRRAEAARALEPLLESWKRADEDLPLVGEARAMSRRLAPAAGRQPR